MNYDQSDRDQEIHDTFFVDEIMFEELENDMLELQFKLGTSI